MCSAFCCMCFVFLAVIPRCDCSRVESKLIEQIFDGYHTSARPVDNVNDTTDVKIKLSIFQIRSLDLRNQEITLNLWIRMRWHDSYLTWDPTAYEGLQQLRLPISDIWRPDVLLYNSVDSERTAVETLAETNAEVHYDGQVDWATVSLAVASCKVNIRDYPYDKQVCPLQFGSWTYDDRQLNLTAWEDAADLTNFIPNGEWDIQAATAKRHENIFTCCPDEVYPDVTYYLQLQRKSLFYDFNLVLPCVWLVIIAVLVFYLPPLSGEKVSLAITVLLAMVVFLLLIAENMPPTSEGIPILGKFFGATVILLSISTVVSVIITNIAFSGDQGRRAPKWFRNLVFKYVSRLVCMSETAAPFVSEDSDYTDLKVEPANNQRQSQDSDKSSLVLADIRDKLDELKSELSSRNTATDRAEYLKNEWVVLAVIMDRLFLFIYAVVSVVMMLAILLGFDDDRKALEETKPISNY